jgi:hypothetical protein
MAFVNVQHDAGAPLVSGIGERLNSTFPVSCICVICELGWPLEKKMRLVTDLP